MIERPVERRKLPAEDEASVSAQKRPESHRAPKSQWWRGYATVAAVFAIGASLAVAGFWVTRSAGRRAVQAEFDYHAEIRSEAIGRSIQEKLLVLESMQAMYIAAEGEPRSEFYAFARRIRSQTHGVQAYEWIARVRDSQREAFEAARRREGREGFEIRERDDRGLMVRAAQRPEYYAVFSDEPAGEPAPTAGFDLGSDPIRRGALERARDTAAVAATSRVRLVQETEEKFGFLVYFPVYEGKTVPTGLQERRERIKGFVLGVFRISDIVEQALEPFESEGLDLRLIDDSATGEERLLCFHPSPTRETPPEPTERFRGFRPEPHAATLQVADRRWRVLSEPAPYFTAAHAQYYHWGILAAGLAFSSLFAAYLLVGIRRTAAIERIAAELEVRAAELTRLNETLEGEIVERGRAEEELRLSAGIIENMPGGVLLIRAESGEIVYTNRGIEELFGYGPGELVGRHVSALNAPGAKEPDETAWEIIDALETSGAWDGEIHNIKKDGTSFWTRAIVSTFEHERFGKVWLTVQEDITEKKQAEEALHKSGALLAEAERMADLGHWEFDLESREAHWSKGMIRIFGLDKELEELDVDRFLDRIHPEDREAVNRTVAEAIKHVSYHEFSYRIVMPDGAERILRSDTEVTRNDEGRAIRTFGVVQDVTEQRRAEERHRKMEARLLQTQKLESLGVLAGGVAHDFNNLLMGILGNADLVRTGLPPGTVAPEIDDIIQAARRAAELSAQMLAYSGKGQFVVKAVDLSAAVAEIGPLLKASVSKKAALEIDLARELPSIEADVTQLGQVIMNLILNASEAIGEQSGSISVSTGALQCDEAFLASCYLDDGLPAGRYVYLKVRDTGRGMDAQTLAKIFDPFFTTKFAGRGLGLAALLGIVRGHRGALRVQSEPERGTTFEVYFPASAKPAQSLAARKKPAKDWNGGGTVLLVDDEYAVREPAARMLERAGMTVITASDGIEAVEIYRQRAEEIALVVLDMTMPRMGGEEAMRVLRSIDPRVRVLLTSGYNQNHAAGAFADLGLFGFIQKPYAMDDFIEKVRLAIES